MNWNPHQDDRLDIVEPADGGDGWRHHVPLAVGTALLVMLAVDVGTRWAEAGTRISRHCEGDAAVYSGSVRGDGVLAINPYDRPCAELADREDPEPVIPGDSHPTPTKDDK